MGLSLAVLLLARRFVVHRERETVQSLVRGLVQMALVGLILALLLQGSLLVGVLILLGMTVAAAATASRRAKGTPDALLLSFYAIAAGSRIVIAAMLANGVLHANIPTPGPLGSMIIANATNACAPSM